MMIDCVERVMGTEPTYRAWEVNVLPLNYTRLAAQSIAEFVQVRPSAGMNAGLIT